jgi:hypothetical protein
VFFLSFFLFFFFFFLIIRFVYFNVFSMHALCRHRNQKTLSLLRRDNVRRLRDSDLLLCHSFAAGITGSLSL